MAWDRRGGDGPVDEAAYGWMSGEVVRKGKYFDPEYVGISLDGFLEYRGQPCSADGASRTSKFPIMERS